MATRVLEFTGVFFPGDAGGGVAACRKSGDITVRKLLLLLMLSVLFGGL